MRWRRKPHVHAHREIGIQHQKGTWTMPGEATLVLHRCPCGDKYSTYLLGTWTLAQVRGHAQADEIEQLADDIGMPAAHSQATPLGATSGLPVKAGIAHETDLSWPPGTYTEQDRAYDRQAIERDYGSS